MWENGFEKMDFRTAFAKTVVVTGGIACGKSTVLETLGDMGFRTASSDAIVKEMWLEAGTTQQVLDKLGWEPPLDFRWLSEQMAANPLVRKQLNHFFHRPVMERLVESRAEIVEIPLAFESCVFGFFPVIVTVDCGRAVQMERLKERWPDRTDISAILGSQLGGLARIVCSDNVIRTDTDLASVKKSTEKLGVTLRSTVF